MWLCRSAIYANTFCYGGGKEYAKMLKKAVDQYVVNYIKRQR